MRYKNNVLEKLNQIDNIANRIQVQINRNYSKEDMSASVGQLKEAIEKIREIISIESDEFERQF